MDPTALANAGPLSPARMARIEAYMAHQHGRNHHAADHHDEEEEEGEGEEVDEEQDDVVDGEEEEGEEEDEAVVFDTTHDPSLHGLREISPLASWSVSTHKPTCGTTALLTPSPHSFWQSDGPQPHLLTAHFFKLVRIVRLRIYLDFGLDESYTPTRMEFWGGWASSGYGMVQFAEWTATEPHGWQEISLEGCGVRGKSEVRCMVLQLRVMENHQNGKDTHVRGVQVFAVDESVSGRRRDVLEEHERQEVPVQKAHESRDEEQSAAVRNALDAMNGEYEVPSDDSDEERWIGKLELR